MRRLLLACSILALSAPALALADGHPHATTVLGTISANTSGVISVSASGSTVTCTVPNRAAASIAKLGLGIQVRITCRPAKGGGLVLAELHPVKSHDPGHGNAGSGGDSGKHDSGTGTTGAGTGTGDDGSTGTPTTTTPATTTPSQTPPPPPPAQHRDAVGIVFFLSSTGMAVRPDAGGEPLTCAITPAPDSQAAAAKLTLNGHFAVTCRMDGGRWVLAGATLAK
jgi:hypothetical protein